MSTTAEHLKILELTESSTASELKSAYRREITTWHPDKYYCRPEMLPTANEKAKLINAAFEYLSELHDLGHLPRPPSSSQTAAPGRYQTQEYETRHTYDGKGYTTGFPDSTVFEVFVKSSHIVSAGYNSTTRTLYLKFTGNTIYSYENVPEQVYREFLAAESHGKFAHRWIYSQYRTRRH